MGEAPRSGHDVDLARPGADGHEHDDVGTRMLAAANPHMEEAGGPPWAGFAIQTGLITVAALLYFGVRMVTKEAETTAFRNAERLLDFERTVGLDIEIWAQELILDSTAVVTFFNWVYIWLHWPVVVGGLLWLYRYNRRGFVMFRNSLIISGAIGLVFFMSFPVAPPRFLPDFTDTVSDLSTSYKYLQPPSIVNKFAAMPSLHVGWNLLAGVILFGSLRPPVRYVPLISPVLMTISVVVTANHYVVDAIAGAAIAVFALWCARIFTDWSEERQRVDTAQHEAETLHRE